MVMDLGGCAPSIQLHPPGGTIGGGWKIECSLSQELIKGVGIKVGRSENFSRSNNGRGAVVIGYSRFINGVRRWLATEQKVHTEPTRGKVCLRVDGRAFMHFF